MVQVLSSRTGRLSLQRMAPLPKDFVACEKETLQGDTKMEENGTEQSDFKKRDTVVITRCLLWSAWPLNSTATTEEAFDRIWGFLGTDSRYLSVRRGTDDSLWALLFKGDQAEINLDRAPEDIRPVALYEISQAWQGTGGHASNRTVHEDTLVRRVHCSNLELPTESRASY